MEFPEISFPCLLGFVTVSTDDFFLDNSAILFGFVTSLYPGSMRIHERKLTLLRLLPCISIDT